MSFTHKNTDFVLGIQLLFKDKFITCIYNNEIKIYKLGKIRFKNEKETFAKKLSGDENSPLEYHKMESELKFSINMNWDTGKSYNPSTIDTIWYTIDGVDFKDCTAAIAALQDEYMNSKSLVHSEKLKGSEETRGEEEEGESEYSVEENRKEVKKEDEKKNSTNKITIEEENEEDEDQEEDKEKDVDYDDLYNQYMKFFKDTFNQIEKGKNGIIKMFELINKYVPIVTVVQKQVHVEISEEDKIKLKRESVKDVGVGIIKQALNTEVTFDEQQLDNKRLFKQIFEEKMLKHNLTNMQNYEIDNVKSSKIDNFWWNAIIVGDTSGKKKLREVFVLAVQAGKQAAEEDKKYNKFSSVGEIIVHPNYRPKSEKYSWPCTTVANKKSKVSVIENLIYCVGYFLGYCTIFHAKELKYQQEDTKWRNVPRGEKAKFLSLLRITTFSPRWPDVNQLLVGARICVKFFAENDVTIRLAADIPMLSSLGFNTTTGILQMGKEIVETAYQCNYDKKIIKYNKAFNKHLSIIDKTKNIRSRLNLSNNIIKTVSNGCALTFYAYVMFKANNEFMKLMSLAGVTLANIVGETGHFMEDTTNILINYHNNSKKTNDTTQLTTPNQHAFVFFNKPISTLMLDGVSVAMMFLNGFDYVSNATMVGIGLGCQSVKLFKQGFYYFFTRHANKAGQSNFERATFKVEEDPNRSPIDSSFFAKKNNVVDQSQEIGNESNDSDENNNHDNDESQPLLINDRENYGT